MDRIIAVVGPTASGKTSLSINLAEILHGEIISCDSMQIYKKMNIGTAKPSEEEKRGIPHHLIDIVEPFEEFSCADYVRLAKEKIKDLFSRDVTPVFCGGTGLYVDHTLLNTSFSELGSDEVFRKSMNDFANIYGKESLHSKLGNIDPISASKIHFNDVKRVIRALEIYHLTGKTKSEWDIESHSANSEYDSIYILLDFKDREKLYSRINKRVDLMICSGLEKEVYDLYDSGCLKANSTAGQAIGYKEFIDFFNGKISKDQAIEQIKKSTRNYAKRQLTWFHANKNAKIIYVDDCSSTEELTDKALRFAINGTEEK